MEMIRTHTFWQVRWALFDRSPYPALRAIVDFLGHVPSERSNGYHDDDLLQFRRWIQRAFERQTDWCRYVLLDDHRMCEWLKTWKLLMSDVDNIGNERQFVRILILSIKEPRRYFDFGLFDSFLWRTSSISRWLWVFGLEIPCHQYRIFLCEV